MNAERATHEVADQISVAHDDLGALVACGAKELRERAIGALAIACDVLVVDGNPEPQVTRELRRDHFAKERASFHARARLLRGDDRRGFLCA